jgi:hypothetical protein
MPNDTRDTEPSPPPGVQAEIADAAADDLDDVLAAMRVQLSNLETISRLLRSEAAEARR